MITLDDLRNGLQQPIHYDHSDIFYVPCFLNDDRSLTIEMQMATTDEQMAWSYEPFYVYVLTGKFDCVVPADLTFYENHGMGD